MYTIEIRGMEKLQTAIERSPKEVYSMLNKSIQTSLNIIRPILKDEAPRGKTGKLRGNIHVRMSGSLSGEVGPDLDVTPYAYYVHQGTQPYTIRPNRKKALFWPGAPGGHPWKSVRHPGIKANKYVERTFKKIQIPVTQIFEKSIEGFITNFHSR